MRKAIFVFTLAVSLIPAWALAQDMPADTMKILQEKVRADKKLVVAANMGLTESEAKGFWPVYEAYQKELQGINDRLAKLINTYAQEYNNNTLTDEKAKTLTDETMAIEQAQVNLHKSYVPKFSKVLPAKKVARYLQIENKIRAAIMYELARGVPLVE